MCVIELGENPEKGPNEVLGGRSTGNASVLMNFVDLGNGKDP